MNTRFLFPHRSKAIGWPVLGIGLVLGVLYLHFDWQPRWLAGTIPWLRGAAVIGTDYTHNFIVELSGLCCIVGALLVACSREPYEDEFIMRLRLESLLWAIYINYALLAVALLLAYDMLFFNLMVYSMFTPLVLFLLRFHYVLYRTARAARCEE